MTRVFFAVRDTRFRGASAESFGTIEFLLEEAGSPFFMDRLLAQLVNRLRELEFDPATDILAITGPMTHVVAMFLAAYELSEGSSLRALIYDARVEEYRERLVDPFQAVGTA